MDVIKITETFECPQFNEPKTLTVEYQEVHTREPGRHFKRGKIHKNCTFYDDCPLKDGYSRCPVYLKFPNPKIL